MYISKSPAHFPAIFKYHNLILFLWKEVPDAGRKNSRWDGNGSARGWKKREGWGSSI